MKFLAIDGEVFFDLLLLLLRLLMIEFLEFACLLKCLMKSSLNDGLFYLFSTILGSVIIVLKKLSIFVISMPAKGFSLTLYLPLTNS